ncbi:MAG TPA: M56 family metallopeptidase, partial [Salegentibacter sp.]|uniref:M56 family metallopeptidase n=1 Tax=Salegentibacter sp. TaxID=1903072 RepID=UPI002F92F100
MTHYILQVIIFQLVFLLAYELLLKKETFFNANRAYLLLTPVLSLLLPFLKVEGLENLFPTEAVQGITTVWLPEVFIGSQPQAKVQLPGVMIQQQGFQINWWLVAYFSGVLLSTLLFFKKYQNLSRLFSFRRISKEKDFSIVEVPNSKIACTFYKTVFLGDQLSEEEKQQILSHELVHVKQKHSLDLVFFELLKIIFWFNPLVYIFQHRIAILHEFIADASVVKTTKKRNYYEQLLNTAFNTRNISFINQFFNHSLIKKRILMLQKS